MIEEQARYFWTGGAEGQLLVARCDQCRVYQHPPLQRCAACGGDAFTPSPVSGRGRVATFTVNHEAWMPLGIVPLGIVPGLSVPFVFAAVELVEQAQLYVFSNILSPVDRVRIGMPVSVYFEQRGDVYLPLFRPDERN